METLRHPMSEVILNKVLLEFVDIGLERLDFRVLALRDPPDKNRDTATILREDGGHRLADKDPGQMSDFQTALDRVIIGEGEEVHLGPAQFLKKEKRIGNTGRHVQSSEQPLGRAEAVTGMEMKIDECHEILGRFNARLHAIGRAILRKLSLGESPLPYGCRREHDRVSPDDPSREDEVRSLARGFHSRRKKAPHSRAD